MTSNDIRRRPIKFTPLFKEKIWGGHNLASILSKKLPSGKIGESWEISALKPDVSVSIENESLDNIIKSDPVQILGERLANDEFPLLYKFIDANDNLSIQVHPDDTISNGITVKGKTECWYIVDAKPDAKIIVGFKKDVSADNVKFAIEEDTLSDYLDMIPVKKGDVLFIPAGTVHAIMAGTLIYELQESSDITYRLYDWGRLDNLGKSRELHIEDSINVLNFHADKNYLVKPIKKIEENFYTVSLRAGCKYFNLEEWELKDESFVFLPQKDVFTILTLIEGKITLKIEDNELICNIGETVLIPAACQGNVSIEWNNNARFLYSYVP